MRTKYFSDSRVSVGVSLPKDGDQGPLKNNHCLLDVTLKALCAPSSFLILFFLAKQQYAVI